jgi:hypothetical protein
MQPDDRRPARIAYQLRYLRRGGFVGERQSDGRYYHDLGTELKKTPSGDSALSQMLRYCFFPACPHRQSPGSTAIGNIRSKSSRSGGL